MIVGWLGELKSRGHISSIDISKTTIMDLISHLNPVWTKKYLASELVVGSRCSRLRTGMASPEAAEAEELGQSGPKESLSNFKIKLEWFT